MEEVDATKSTSNDGEDFVTSSLETDSSTAANMRKDVTLSHLYKCKFSVVAVSREICIVSYILPLQTRQLTFQAMKTSAH